MTVFNASLLYRLETRRQEIYRLEETASGETLHHLRQQRRAVVNRLQQMMVKRLTKGAN